MPRIIWDDNFSVGNDTIDSQHKKWINIFNKAHDRMMAPKKDEYKQIGVEALDEMLAYCRHHLASEEKWMEEISYHDIDHHRSLHKDLFAMIDRITLEIHEGRQILNSEIIKMIENWLVEHILVEDKKITSR